MGQLTRESRPPSYLQAVVISIKLSCIVCQPYLGQHGPTELQDRLENVCQLFSFHSGSEERAAALPVSAALQIVKDVEKFVQCACFSSTYTK